MEDTRDTELENQSKEPGLPIKEHTKSVAWVAGRIRADLNYKTSINLLNKLRVFENFRNGEQWPPVTAETKDWPRCVFNLVQYVENHKVSAVMNENITMVFSNQEGDYEDGGLSYKDSEPIVALADKYTKFSAATWENIKQRQLNEKMLHQASNKGLGILHYYWNDRAKGGRKLKYLGELSGEVINPANIAFGNPQCLYVEPQPYIIIKSRESVTSLRKEARANGMREEDILLITADKDTKDNPYDSAQVEMETEEGKANTYIIYFKDDVFVTEQDPETGEYNVEMEEHVFYQKMACDVNITKAEDLEIKKYPIAIMAWNEKEECIFGIGDAEWSIPNQRIINLLCSLMVLSVQLTGFPRIVYKSQYIRKETITNAIGAMIEDISQGPGIANNVDYLKPGPISPLAQELTDNFMQYTKTLLGANESSTGELSKAGQMNATAIALLQKASGVPIEGIKGRFYQCMEDVGLIWEEFFKVKYNTARLVTYKDEDNKEQTMLFRGSEARGIDFKLKIDIGPSSDYTETYVIQSLDRFLDAGYMDLDSYLKYVPRNFVPYKEQWIKDREAQRKQQEMQDMQDVVASLNPAEKAALEQARPEQQQLMMQKLIEAKKQSMMQNEANQNNPQKQ
jgi:hypothetical protein